MAKNFKQLVHGATYINRLGNTVKVTKVKIDSRLSSIYTFQCAHRTYTKSGEYLEGEENKYDLVEKVESKKQRKKATPATKIDLGNIKDRYLRVVVHTGNTEICGNSAKQIFVDDLLNQTKNSENVLKSEHLTTGEKRETLLEKPPIGILPRKMHDKFRAEELIEVIFRYVKTNKVPKSEWVEELSGIFQNLTK